jgi:lysophospholipase L1-like esterase
VLYGAGWTGNIISNRNYFPLSGKLSVNRVEVSNRPTTNLRMVFHMSHAQPIYGLVSEGGNGVYLDNFSFRGTTGLTLDRIPMSHLQGLNAIRPYDLIVLQYGVNVANYHTKGFEWYRKGMVKIIARLRTAFPKASILLIGTSDRGARIDGVLKTDPVIHSLLRTQRLLAQETGASFIDLFNGMGGEGSMIAWAQGDTVYANADFTHFNQRGSRRVGKILSDSLLGAWNHYRMNAKAPEVLR